jgi:hypothetical protein
MTCVTSSGNVTKTQLYFTILYAFLCATPALTRYIGAKQKMLTSIAEKTEDTCSVLHVHFFPYGLRDEIKIINSGAFVRQRTIPTERQPPLVGEVRANFTG